MDEQELTKLDELAAAATPGPWEIGDRLHVQGASHCTCAEHYGPLIWQGKHDINGEVMDTHIHRRTEPLSKNDTSIYGGGLSQDQVCVALSTSEYVKIAPENAEFIAAAREALPRLVDEVRRLRAENGRWRTAAAEVLDAHDCGEAFDRAAREASGLRAQMRSERDELIRLAAVVERVRAEALREAARDCRTAWLAGDHGDLAEQVADLIESTLNARADRIEQEGAGRG